MPIAIYRHRKLFVAMQKANHSQVRNLNRRQIVDVIGKNDNYIPTIEIVFATLLRRNGLRADTNTVWNVSQQGVSVVHANWFGFRSRRTAPVMYPPLTNIVWTDKDNSDEIFESFERGIASQPIMERYLHEHTANAFNYNILRVDLPEDGIIKTSLIPPRHMTAVNVAETEDDSDSADAWLKLLLG